MERSRSNMDERTASPQEVGDKKDWNFPPGPNGIDDFFDVPGLSVDGRTLPGWSEKVSDGPVRIRMVRFGQKLMRRFEKRIFFFRMVHVFLGFAYAWHMFSQFFCTLAHIFLVKKRHGTSFPRRVGKAVLMDKLCQIHCQDQTVAEHEGQQNAPNSHKIQSI